MALLLVETSPQTSQVRVVLHNGALSPYINGGWLLEAHQVIAEWRVRDDGTAYSWRSMYGSIK